MIAALLLAAVQDGPPPPADMDRSRYQSCVALARSKPAEGVAEANRWRQSGGGFLAQQCLGIALAGRGQWVDAAQAFEQAASEGSSANADQVANFWAQAGNAWAAGGDFARANAAFDKALAAGTLRGLDLGELYLDRARVHVAQGNKLEARSDLNLALRDAGDDPLAWLLSATLARQMGDLDTAKRHIAEAMRRAPDDASVQLEAGNIAALNDDEKGAREAWTAAMNLAPGTEVGISARAALKQFGPDGAKDDKPKDDKAKP